MGETFEEIVSDFVKTSDEWTENIRSQTHRLPLQHPYVIVVPEAGARKAFWHRYFDDLSPFGESGPEPDRFGMIVDAVAQSTTPPHQSDGSGSSGSSVVERFERDRAEWKEATQFSSSVDDIVMHPAYQRIIGLGPAALPLIVSSLRAEIDHWFWALAAIAGTDLSAGASSLPEAAQLWIEAFDGGRIPLDA